MKRRLYALMAFIVLVPLAAGSAAAQDFGKGLEAALRGDYDAALAQWRPLAEQGDAFSQYNLGVMFDHGAGVPQDYAEALKWYRLAAEQGNADAQSNLGVMYAVGKGVPPDQAEAIKWYRLAAEQGNTNAQSNLGVMFYSGNGVARDESQALMWLELSASKGHQTARKNRDIVARNMSAEQIAEARHRANAWQEAHLQVSAAQSPGSALSGLSVRDEAPPARPVPQQAATPSAEQPLGAAAQIAAAGPAWRIQLASLPSEPGARLELERLQKTHADLIGGLGLLVRKVNLSKGTYYRIQSGALADRAAARALCGELKSRNQPCLTVSS